MRYETDALHVLTACPKLQDRRRAHVNIFMYKRTARADLIDNREIRTRAHDAPLFKVKVPKKESYKRAVEYFGAVQWNSLPVDVRNIQNIETFKHDQKLKLTNNIK